MKHCPHTEPRCSMCGSTNPVDHGLMCKACRAEDDEIERMFLDGVDPLHREPGEMK